MPWWIPLISVGVTMLVVMAGVVANYSVTKHRVGGVERKIDLVLEKSEAFAALGFTVAQHSKAIEMHDKELRRARNRIHRIDGALGQAVLLLHLIRRGVEVPTEVIDKIARDANSSGEPVEEE